MKKIVALCISLLMLTACAEQELQLASVSKASDPIVQEIYAMDTYMTLTAYGEAEGAVRLAADEIQRLDALWSISSADGDIARLNAKAQESVADETRNLILRSLAIHDLTGGVFECTILPIMQAWGFTTQEHHVLDQTELDALLPLVDSNNIVIDGNEVTLLNGSTVDLGGIAKGFTSQYICDLLRENGVTSAIINLGGNVQAVGTKPDGSPWRIAVKDPTNLEELAAVISVDNQAVITSGAYERYFEQDGVMYHHIIDPATGRPSNSGLLSCTIVCDDGTLGDGLSTSLFIMGLDQAISFWRLNDGEFDMVLITEEGEIYITPRLEDRFALQGNYTDYEVILQPEA